MKHFLLLFTFYWENVIHLKVFEMVFILHILLEVIQFIDLLGQRCQFLLEEIECHLPQLLAILVQTKHGIVDGIVGEGAGPGRRTIATLQQGSA